MSYASRLCVRKIRPQLPFLGLMLECWNGGLGGLEGLGGLGGLGGLEGLEFRVWSLEFYPLYR